MKVVIIGYGSIGRKHAKILSRNFKNIEIYIYTKQIIKNFNYFKDINEIKTINPQYIVIASETHKHYKQLKFLEKSFKKIKILIEKPLFHKFFNFSVKNNEVYTAYNLRFHPLVIKLKKFLKNKDIYDVNLITNSYLPNWRKNISFKKNYAGFKSKGGGIILDLSHELDFLHSIFKNLNLKYVDFNKKSNLTHNTEDNLKLYARSNKTHISVDLKYYSKNEIRIFLIDGKNFSVLLDLKNNVLKIQEKRRKFLIKKTFSQEKTLLEMHKALINNKNKKFLCSFNQGKEVLKAIEKIKKFK